MQSENLICEKFNIEVWRYLDSDLTADELLFWEKHLAQCLSCSKHLSETVNTLNSCPDIQLADLDDDKFNNMVNTAVRAGKQFHNFKFPFSFNLKHWRFSLLPNFAYYKQVGFALSAGLVVLILILNNKPVTKTIDKTPTMLSRSVTEYQNSLPVAERKGITTATTPPAKARIVRSKKVHDWKGEEITRQITGITKNLIKIEIKDDSDIRFSFASDVWKYKARSLGEELQKLEKEINN